jgi:hypothetical protein
VTKTTEEIVAELAELRRELFTLIGRVRRLEDRIEAAIEAPPIEKRVVPPSVVGTAAQLGEELVEGRRIGRAVRDSAQSLRRAVASESHREDEDTVEIKIGVGSKKDV